jgi:hypothetical protein
VDREIRETDRKRFFLGAFLQKTGDFQSTVSFFSSTYRTMFCKNGKRDVFEKQAALFS